MTGPMLTLAETAGRLRISVSFVRKLCATGELVSCRFGRRVLIEERDLETYVGEHRRGLTQRTAEVLR